MGRRSRKRGDEVTTPPPPSASSRRAASRRTRPPAPWHPFPLVELCVLIGLVLMVWGFFRAQDDTGRVLLVSGMALASLGGLETAAREHFSGYQSHAVLLAGLPALVVAGVVYFARAPWIAVVVLGAVLFAGTYALLRRSFRARS